MYIFIGLVMSEKYSAEFWIHYQEMYYAKEARFAKLCGYLVNFGGSLGLIKYENERLRNFVIEKIEDTTREMEDLTVELTEMREFIRDASEQINDQG